jgi:hypothetical protein
MDTVQNIHNKFTLKRNSEVEVAFSSANFANIQYSSPLVVAVPSIVRTN